MPEEYGILLSQTYKYYPEGIRDYITGGTFLVTLGGNTLFWEKGFGKKEGFKRTVGKFLNIFAGGFSPSFGGQLFSGLGGARTPLGGLGRGRDI